MPIKKTGLPRSLYVAGALTFAFALVPEPGQAQQSSSQPQENQQQSNAQQPLVQELNSLPTGKNKDFYRQALKERDYQIMQTTLDTKDVLQLEVEKNGKKIAVSIGFDTQTGQSKEVQAALLSESSPMASSAQSQHTGKADREEVSTEGASQQGQETQGTVVARVPIVKEKVQVGKREVQTGGVRIETQVMEKPVEKDVELRKEQVTIERRQVDRPVTEADKQALRDAEKTIVIAETAEKAVVSKDAKVVEEIVVRKEEDQRTATVQDTVRRTDVNVEQVDSQQQARTVQQDGTSHQLVQELEALPLEQNEQFYRETLKERGYQIMDTKGDKKQKEFQVEKDAQTVMLVVMFDEQTGNSTNVKASQQGQQ